MTNLPRPSGWRLLVKTRKPKEKTSGGIILSDSSKEAEAYLNITAEVVAMGPICFHDRNTGEAWKGGVWCKPGDNVIIPKFTPLKFEIDGVDYRIINDDEVIATIDDPSVIKVYS